VSFQRLKTRKHSNDPNYERKKNRILHLYGLMDGTVDVHDGDPGRGHLRRRVRPAQSATPPGPPLDAGRWRRPNATTQVPRHRQASHGVHHLLAAYDLSQDELYGHIAPCKRRGEFLVFLGIGQTTP
jgi:hypothetical protein